MCDSYLSHTHTHTESSNTLRYVSPRYKLRPKMHQFHCEIVLRLAGGSRVNPRLASCYSEEDFIGKVMSSLKRSIHPSSLSSRVIQRWLLQLNCWIIASSWKRCSRHSWFQVGFIEVHVLRFLVFEFSRFVRRVCGFSKLAFNQRSKACGQQLWSWPTVRYPRPLSLYRPRTLNPKP